MVEWLPSGYQIPGLRGVSLPRGASAESSYYAWNLVKAKWCSSSKSLVALRLWIWNGGFDSIVECVWLIMRLALSEAGITILVIGCALVSKMAKALFRECG
jgi:hypothetical protein